MSSVKAGKFGTYYRFKGETETSGPNLTLYFAEGSVVEATDDRLVIPAARFNAFIVELIHMARDLEVCSQAAQPDLMATHFPGVMEALGGIGIRKERGHAD